jgi:transcription-repair coupling factor (superfamily II helicase)
VGRSHHQAYAYLLVPDVEALTKQAALRLDAIQQMEELGSGFYLAMHDLEIRGAGEVLGENQSGNILEIGFQLYNEMLAEAVRSLKAGKEPDLLAPLSVTTDINLHAPALLPSDYCGDVHLRLSFYKKLASAKTTEQIDALLEELDVLADGAMIQLMDNAMLHVAGDLRRQAQGSEVWAMGVVTDDKWKHHATFFVVGSIKEAIKNQIKSGATGVAFVDTDGREVLLGA